DLGGTAARRPPGPGPHRERPRGRDRPGGGPLPRRGGSRQQRGAAVPARAVDRHGSAGQRGGRVPRPRSRGRRLPECPGETRTGLAPRYAPDLPFLDHPLVRVLWSAEEPSDLTAERRAFERFLLDLAEDEDAYAPGGVYAGYRSVTGRGEAADDMADEHVAGIRERVFGWVERFDPVEWHVWAQRADRAYQEASEPATILLAFDRSTSMASVPQQFDAARTAATTIIGRLRAQD